jgi:Serine/Threonine/Tyrosine Kinase found in polyvalent proteins
MYNDETKRKLENIIRGSLIEGDSDNCTAVRNFLCTSFSTSTTVKRNFESKLLIKKEQESGLRNYATNNQLWFTHLPAQYLTRGGEAQIYLDIDSKHVVKINDAIYYATWLEYFNSLLLHNLIFKDTAYTFMGFINLDNVLHAVVRQPFIIADGQAALDDIRAFLEYNGFENTRRHDYFNKTYGLILEDMHDENVILNSEKLFFIDTVFYTVSVK